MRYKCFTKTVLQFFQTRFFTLTWTCDPVALITLLTFTGITSLTIQACCICITVVNWSFAFVNICTECSIKADESFLTGALETRSSRYTIFILIALATVCYKNLNKCSVKLIKPFWSWHFLSVVAFLCRHFLIQVTILPVFVQQPSIHSFKLALIFARLQLGSTSDPFRTNHTKSCNRISLTIVYDTLSRDEKCV